MTGIQYIISANGTVALYKIIFLLLYFMKTSFFSNLKGKLFLIALDDRKREMVKIYS